ncbi:uncharacterized protein LOC109820001 isoform X2 [Asparagus officinalis]|uniref:uncharacterized protein LOC109820001 isoform X2 n=1 Tax=Asparagus officinalis TaxID=4686 RepID=UPI00098E4D42|nr:uncharacterized protein LOC109820001 isoform X2 [Asparagus officinalis]
MAWRLLLSTSYIKPFRLLPPPPPHQIPSPILNINNTQFHYNNSNKTNSRALNLRGPIQRRAQDKNSAGSGGVSDEQAEVVRRAQQGDPLWAIKSSTISDLIGLSLNFFYVLPLLNYAGIHVLEAPVLHPMSEGLFNFVISWTLLFAPLLFTDCRRDRYKWSLDILWGFQMFLTNTFLIPYMAIRLNDKDLNTPQKQTPLASLMTNGAQVVGLIGGGVCLLSIFWALFARGDGDFGNITDRLEFLGSYLGSERLAYAFIWDICLYAIFQPWLIRDNLQNVKPRYQKIVRNLRYIPVVGLVAYLVSLDDTAGADI